jgi:FAD/FMN-containing dehydrogenase
VDPRTLATLDGGTARISGAALDAFQTQLRLPLLCPTDPIYGESCLLWNGMIAARPALVARPTGVADVLACVRFAREHGLLLSIKGGGHNIAGTALAANGFLLDMARMKGVHVDPATRTARVQAGCLLGDVDRETQVHGLAAVLGFVSETGVAGLTLGGGFGYLTRRRGWTVDTLQEVEIVTADGALRRASRQVDPDLFWALRGGGGNFGVATSFTFALETVGPRVLAGGVFWDGELAPEILAQYREWSLSAPRELTTAITMRKAPAAPFLPKEWHGRPIIGMVACHSGTDLARAAMDLAPMRGFRKPIVDVVVEKPYLEQQRMLDATQPKGLHYYWKSEFVPRLDGGLLSVAAERAALQTSPMSQLILFHIGGALSERASDDGAVGNRDAQWVCGVAGAWRADDADAAAHQRWARDTWEGVRPFSTGGSYVNFQTADEGEDRLRASYGANFERLAAAKRAYDPDNLFRVNRNVRPA